jgi:uncharacterized coiled-coil protein SlyX
MELVMDEELRQMLTEIADFQTDAQSALMQRIKSLEDRISEQTSLISDLSSQITELQNINNLQDDRLQELRDRIDEPAPSSRHNPGMFK